jgi:hypothetical protein
MANSKEGHCSLCGESRKLSFEHVPPQSAFNDKPIFMQDSDHLFNQKSYVYGKRMRSHKGFGRHTLCEPCNNNTGSWYANDFAEFAHQGMKIIRGLDKPRYNIEGTYLIKPLNVLKQILTMFMSADGIVLRSNKELVDFILDKNSNSFPERFKVYLYSTLSSRKRMCGYTIATDANLKPQKWCEINFQPFGYLLADESEPAHKDMVDISGFSKHAYNQKAAVLITTPYLIVESPFPGSYGK